MRDDMYVHEFDNFAVAWLVFGNGDFTEIYNQAVVFYLEGHVEFGSEQEIYGLLTEQQFASMLRMERRKGEEAMKRKITEWVNS